MAVKRGGLGKGLDSLIPDTGKTAEKEKKDGSFGFFSEPLFYLCVATLFFYLCAEQGVIGWMITYFKDTGFLPASLSQMTASVLWVMILAGRLPTAWLSTRMQKEKLLPIMDALADFGNYYKYAIK